MLTMAGGTIRNDGDLTQHYQANYDLDYDSGGGAGTIENHGTWTLTNSSTFYNSNGGGVISNSGNFNQAGSVNASNAAFNNLAGGTLNSTAGYILLQGGGSLETGATLNADGGSIYFNGGGHVLSGGTLTGADFTYVSAGSVTVTGDVGAASGPATGGFGISGGVLGGSATVSADHGYLGSGSIGDSVVMRFTGDSSKSNNTMLYMAGGTIRNDGNFSQAYQANYDLDSDNGPGAGTIVNNGSWTLANNSAFYNTYGGGVIENSGNFNQAGGVNASNAAFNNQAGGTLNSTAGYILLQGGGTQEVGSTLHADGGGIYFNGGQHTLNGGTLTGADFTYVNAGSVSVAGDVGAVSGPATGGFGIAGGVLGGSAMVSADHGYLGSGTIGDTVVMRFTGASSKSNYTMLYMTGGTIRNEGEFSQSYQANYDLDADDGGGAGTIINKGTWNLSNSSQFSNTYGGGLISNAGNFNQLAADNNINAAFANLSGGTLTATSGVIHLRGGGSLASGATLNADGGSIYFQGGTHEFNGGMLTGSSYSYVVGGLVNVNHNVGVTSGPATGGFSISGGTVGGTAMISADHGYVGDGAITGSAVLRFTGASSKGNYSMLYMGGGTIQNDGTFTQGYQGNIDTDSDSGLSAGTIRNNGTWNLVNSSYITNTQGGGVIENTGDFNQLAGDNNINAAFANLAGGMFTATNGVIRLRGGGSLAPGATLNADGGSIYFQGGTHEFNGGTLTGSTHSYVISGLVNINDNVGATSGPATGGFSISGGTVGGTAMISADHGYVGDGAITGSAVLRFTGASSKGNYSMLYMGGGTIQNDGTFTQGYQGNIDTDSDSGSSAGTIRNNGTWNLVNSSYITNSQGGGVIENSGSFNQLAGVNFIQAHVINSGTISSESGTIYLQGGSLHSGGLVTNSSIVLGSGAHNMAGSAAYLGGSGELYGNLTLADGARIAPGNPVGNLTIYGQVDFVSGGTTPACAIELAGPGTSDRISIASGASLDLGANLTDLRISLQYAPSFGEIFRIVSAWGSGHYTGTFRNLPGSGSIITASYQGHAYSLQVAYSGGGKYVDLTVLTPYQTWAYGKGLTGDDAGFNADPDNDGIVNGIEFVIGGEPNPAHPGSNSQSLLPQVQMDDTYLRVVYRRNDDALYLSSGIQYGTDLANPWMLAQQDVNGVIINVVNDGFGPNIDRVEVLIPRGNEVAGKLFARLAAAEP